MLTILAIIALPLLANLAIASPTKLLARSSSEVVYLCNCRSGLPEDVGGIAAEYYGDIDNSHDGETPDSQSNLVTDSHYPDVPTWEGNTVPLFFSDSGITFTSNIAGDAGDLGVGEYAGYGYNGGYFDCYKDNEDTLFSAPDGSGHTAVCTKDYYCRPS